MTNVTAIPVRHRSRPRTDNLEPQEAERSWQTLNRRRADFPLTPELDLLNAYARHGNRGEVMFKWTARKYRRINERYLCLVRPKSAKAVLDAVVARTLGFNKYVEQITYDQFINGLCNRTGNHVLDDDGCPYFAGLEIDHKTLHKNIVALLEARLIERFEFTKNGRRCHAYMPFPRVFLVSAWALAYETFPFQGDRQEVRDEYVRVLGEVDHRWPGNYESVGGHWNLTSLLVGEGPPWAQTA